MKRNNFISIIIIINEQRKVHKTVQTHYILIYKLPSNKEPIKRDNKPQLTTQCS